MRMVHSLFLTLQLPEDPLRVWVLLFAVFILSTGVRSIWYNFRSLKNVHSLRPLLWGRAARETGIIVILLLEMYTLFHRLGNPNFNAETPVFQLALVLLFIGWHFVDRRTYKEMDVTRIVQSLQESMVRKEQRIEMRRREGLDRRDGAR